VKAGADSVPAPSAPVPDAVTLSENWHLPVATGVHVLVSKDPLYVAEPPAASVKLPLVGFEQPLTQVIVIALTDEASAGGVSVMAILLTVTFALLVTVPL